jgi:type IV pilus assembly protein PilM
MSLFDRLRHKPARSGKVAGKAGLIGLDIGSENLHLCQLRPLGDRRYNIVAKSSQDLPTTRQQLLQSPKAFKSVIKHAMQGKKFNGNRVTAILPPDKVKIMLLSYKASVRDLDSEVVHMLSQRVDGDITDYVIDYLPVRNRSADEEHIVMASVARRSDVDEFLKLLEYAGLQPHSLDIGPSALRRLISVLCTDDKTSNVLLINTGEEHSYLTIVSGRRLLFDQPVKFGCNQLFREMADALDLAQDKAKELAYRHGIRQSTAEGEGSEDDNDFALDIAQTLREIIKPAFLNLVEEINRVMIFTASETHGVPLSRVYLLGCLARLPGAHELMRTLMNVPIPTQHDEFHDVFIDDNDHTEAWLNRLPELAVATGLALRGLQDDE